MVITNMWNKLSEGNLFHVLLHISGIFITHSTDCLFEYRTTYRRITICNFNMVITDTGNKFVPLITTHFKVYSSHIPQIYLFEYGTTSRIITICTKNMVIANTWNKFVPRFTAHFKVYSSQIPQITYLNIEPLTIDVVDIDRKGLRLVRPHIVAAIEG